MGYMITLQKCNSYLLFSNVFRASGFCCSCWKWWQQPDDEVQFQPRACQYLQYCSWRWWQQQLLFHYVMYSSSLKCPLSAVSFTICGIVHYLRYRSLSAVSFTICGIVHYLRYRSRLKWNQSCMMLLANWHRKLRLYECSHSLFTTLKAMSWNTQQGFF